MQENPHGREITEAIAEIAGVTFEEVVGAYRRSLEVDEQGNVSIQLESVERELALPSGLFKTCLHASPEAAVELLVSKKKATVAVTTVAGITPDQMETMSS